MLKGILIDVPDLNRLLDSAPNCRQHTFSIIYLLLIYFLIIWSNRE